MTKMFLRIYIKYSLEPFIKGKLITRKVLNYSFKTTVVFYTTLHKEEKENRTS